MTAHIVHGTSRDSADKAIAAAMRAAARYMQAGMRLEISLVSVIREETRWRATLRVEVSEDKDGLPAHKPAEPPQDEAEAQELKEAADRAQNPDKARRARYKGLEGREITPELLYELRDVPLDDLPQGLAEKIHALMLAQAQAAPDGPAHPEIDFAVAAHSTVGQLVNIQNTVPQGQPRPDPA